MAMEDIRSRGEFGKENLSLDGVIESFEKYFK